MTGLRLYLGVWVVLVVGTIVEVLIRTSIGPVAAVAAITILLIVLASGKAVIISLFYQHLRYESWQLSVLPVSAVIGVIILAISVAYTLGMGSM